MGGVSTDEFEPFLDFFGNRWGALAGVSALLPLSNLLFGVVPTEPEVIRTLASVVGPGGIFTLVATIGSLLVLRWTFDQRDWFADQKRRQVQGLAWVTFAGALFLLDVYFVLYAIDAVERYDLLVGPNPDIGTVLFVVYDLVLFVVFVGAFALLTRSFVLLGLVEFLDVPE